MSGTGNKPYWKEQKRCKKCGCWIKESYIGDIIKQSGGTYVSKTERLCKAHKLEVLFDGADKSTQKQILVHQLKISEESG